MVVTNTGADMWRGKHNTLDKSEQHIVSIPDRAKSLPHLLSCTPADQITKSDHLCDFMQI